MSGSCQGQLLSDSGILSFSVHFLLRKFNRKSCCTQSVCLHLISSQHNITCWTWNILGWVCKSSVSIWGINFNFFSINTTYRYFHCLLMNKTCTQTDIYTMFACFMLMSNEKRHPCEHVLLCKEILYSTLMLIYCILNPVEDATPSLGKYSMFSNNHERMHKS